MHKTKLVVTTMLLSACASMLPEEQQSKLNQWKGAHVNELTSSYGPPHKRRTLRDGSCIYTYSYNYPGKTPLTAQEFGYFYSYKCEVRFTLNSEGHVVSAALPFGSCKKYVIERPAVSADTSAAR
ncbi:hypothetical protein AUP74_02152 [Microbulbifer aggregans]|uniref:Lipoprotein n=1 Tax=Microbulbifer aggregans TaxID=1769779 RepID=A0A1C9W8T2_9GAMM|nr:hypothetical protein AUP74_02152 [Microbulbifer aggregans]